MLKLKNKSLLAASVIVPLAPILIIASCSISGSVTTKKTLNDEAKKLKSTNFYYDGSAFDISKKASFYTEVSKVSGVSLASRDVKLKATKLSASGTKLTITYTLKDGSVESDEQTFEYTGFEALSVITISSLNTEAKSLTKANFYYDGKAFDATKSASFYNNLSKVSIISLSASTTSEVAALVSNGTDLSIVYKLKNGSITSASQTFIYTGFKA